MIKKIPVFLKDRIFLCAFIHICEHVWQNIMKNDLFIPINITIWLKTALKTISMLYRNCNFQKKEEVFMKHILKCLIAVMALFCIGIGIVYSAFSVKPRSVWNSVRIDSSDEIRTGQAWPETLEMLHQQDIVLNNDLSVAQIEKDHKNIGFYFYTGEEQESVSTIHYSACDNKSDTKIVLAGLDVSESKYEDFVELAGPEQTKEPFSDETGYVYIWQDEECMTQVETDLDGNVTAFTLTDASQPELIITEEPEITEQSQQ